MGRRPKTEHGVTVRHRRVGKVVGKAELDAVVEGAPRNVGHLGGAIPNRST